jgi:hypothetical protein
MFAFWTLHLLVAVSAVFSIPASVSSLAVPITVTGAIAVLVFVAAIGAFAAMAVFAVMSGVLGFDIVCGGGIEEGLDIES